MKSLIATAAFVIGAVALGAIVTASQEIGAKSGIGIGALASDYLVGATGLLLAAGFIISLAGILIGFRSR